MMCIIFIILCSGYFFLIYITEHNVISKQRLQHFYLEVLKTTNSPIEIERRHNETEVLAWNEIRFQEHLIDTGLLEKYAQTDN